MNLTVNRQTVAHETEPTLIFRIRGVLLEPTYDYTLTLAQGIWKRTFTGNRLNITQNETDTIIIMTLEAADTRAFDYDRECRAQVEWIDDCGRKHATGKAKIYINELLSEVGEEAPIYATREELQAVDDKVISLEEDVTSIYAGTYWVSPEMYGAAGDGETDDAQALNDMFADAVENGLTVRFRPKSYYIGSQVNIPGRITIEGNAAEIIAAAGSNGLIMTALGSRSIIDNLKITSLNTDRRAVAPDKTEINYTATNPSLGTIGLSASGAQLKLSRIDASFFHTCIVVDERLSTAHQTGVIIDNCHARYCCIGFCLGVVLRNGLSTDYTVTNCTAFGSACGIRAADAIGYFFDNIHTWSYTGTEASIGDYGIYAVNCSLTSFNNLYIEVCKNAAMRIASRKGANINNLCYGAYRHGEGDVFGVNPVVISAGGPKYPTAPAYHLNINNVQLRGLDGNPFYLIDPQRAQSGDDETSAEWYGFGVFNVSNIHSTETEMPNAETGYILSKFPTRGIFFLDGMKWYGSPYGQNVHGEEFATGSKTAIIDRTERTASVVHDFSSLKGTRMLQVEVTISTRADAGQVEAGKYIIPILFNYADEVRPGTVTAVVENPRVTVTAGNPTEDGTVNKKKLEVTVTTNTGCYLIMYSEPKMTM